VKIKQIRARRLLQNILQANQMPYVKALSEIKPLLCEPVQHLLRLNTLGNGERSQPFCKRTDTFNHRLIKIVTHDGKLFQYLLGKWARFFRYKLSNLAPHYFVGLVTELLEPPIRYINNLPCIID